MSDDTGSNVITYRIVGTVDGLQKAFTAAGTMTTKFGNTMSEGVARATKPFEMMASKIKDIIAPLAAATVAWASLESVMKSFERSEGLGKVANNLGIAVDKLSQLHYVAELNMSSAEAMDGALKKMAVFLGTVGDAGSEASMSLAKIGLSARDLEGLTVDQAFLKVSDALNTVSSSTERVTLQQKIFGKSSQEVSGVLTQSSAAIREMMNEGKNLGRTMENIEFGKLAAAKDSVEHLQAAFRSLADKLSIALSPAIDLVARVIDKGIGNTNDFKKVFDDLVTNMVYGVGIARMAWQGLQLMWEGAKATVGELSVLIYEAMRGAVKAFLWVKDTGEKVWSVIASSFAVAGNLINVGFQKIRQVGTEAFAYLEKVAGESLRDMGSKLINSGIKGMDVVGGKLMESGIALIGAADRAGNAADKAFSTAKDGLDKSIVALEDARANFSKPADTSTPYFDNMISNAENFRDKAVEAFKDISTAIASQEGGNALTDTWAKWNKALEGFQVRATEVAAKGAQERVGIANLEAEHTASVYAKFWAEHAKKMQEFNDEKLIVNSKDEKIQLARQEEFNADRELSEKKSQDQQVMLFRSGWEGKAQVASQMLGQLATLMNSHNRTAFEIGKIAAISQTIVDTIASASSSFRFGSELGGPVAGAAFAAVAVAAGAVRLGQLAATSYGGGGSASGGGGGGSAPPVTTGGSSTATPTQRNVNITMYGESVSKNQFRNMIGQINEAADDNMSIRVQGASR